MTSHQILFAGVDISSGRKPVTFAGLDDRLEVVILAQWTVPEVLGCLKEYEYVQLAVNIPQSKAGQGIYSDFHNDIGLAGFVPYSMKNSPRLWIASRADDCYRVFQPDLLPRRTLEGRLQRALVLYEEGVLINDPMDLFEEITRHKLMQGVLPFESLYSPKQLDALIMAYVSWLAGNPSERVVMKDDLLLPAPE